MQATFANTVAYYRFEEGTAGSSPSGANTIIDSSGNGLNGTSLGGLSYSALVAANPVPLTGAPNRLSLAFDGSSGRVFIPDNPLFELTNSLTIEAYIEPFPPVESFNSEQIVFRGDDRGGWDPYYLGIFQTNLIFEITDSNNISSFVQAPITPWVWHHVAATLDAATGKQSLYIDGVLVAQTNTTERPFGPLIGANPGLGIGDVQSPNYTEYFNGMIDEVRISDTALGPDQLLNASSRNASLPTLTLNKAVWLSFSNLMVGTNYQVQVSTNLNGAFSDYGQPFSATNSTMAYPAYWNVADWNNLFFRLVAK